MSDVDNEGRIVAYLTRQQRVVLLQRAPDELGCRDFNQAMAELLADCRVERIMVNGRHYFRVAAGEAGA